MADPVLAWFTFFMVCIAAGRIGLLFPRLGLPLITGFLFTGVIAGPYLLNVLEKPMIKPLSIVNQAALSYIAFSAGAELYLPELRALFKSILLQTGGLTVAVMIAITGLVHGMSGLNMNPWGFLPGGCSVSVALVCAAICVTSSPASSIAILKEMKAKGPFASTLLGITVLCDVVVLLMFSFTTTIAETECKGDGFSGTALAIMIGIVLASIVIGLLFGKVLIFLVMFKRAPTRYLILPLGLAIFVACHEFTEWSHHNLPYVINFEPLLMCIAAGFVCTNQSKHRHRFIGVLQQAGPYVFLPFFTLTGASLDLSVLGQCLVFALIVSAMRAFGLFVGAGIGGVIAKQPHRHSAVMWMSQVTQAGVSLGLASEVGMGFPTFGRAFQTAIISVVLVNQVLGPIFFKLSIRLVGEAGKAAGDDEFDEDRIVPTALVVGYTPQTMGIAMKLLNERWNVVMLAGNEEEAAAAREDIQAYGAASRAAADAKQTTVQKVEKQVKDLRTGIQKLQDKAVDGLATAVMAAMHAKAAGSTGGAGAGQAADAHGGAEAGHAEHHDPHHKVWLVEEGFTAQGLLPGGTHLSYDELLPVTGREHFVAAAGTAAAAGGAGGAIQAMPELAEEGGPGEQDHASLAAAGAEWSVDLKPIQVSVATEGSTGATPNPTPTAAGGAGTGLGADGKPMLRKERAAAAAAAAAEAAVAAAMSSGTDFRLSALVRAVSTIKTLASVVVDLPSDAASFAAVEAVHDTIARAPKRSHLYGVRVVALVRAPEWVQPFYKLGAVPVHAGAALVTAMAKVSTAPLARPVTLLGPALNLDELGKAVAKMTEGPHAWKYLPSGFGAEDNGFMTMPQHKAVQEANSTGSGLPAGSPRLQPATSPAGSLSRKPTALPGGLSSLPSFRSRTGTTAGFAPPPPSLDSITKTVSMRTQSFRLNASASAAARAAGAGTGMVPSPGTVEAAVAAAVGRGSTDDLSRLHGVRGGRTASNASAISTGASIRAARSTTMAGNSTPLEEISEQDPVEAGKDVHTPPKGQRQGQADNTAVPALAAAAMPAPAPGGEEASRASRTMSRNILTNVGQALSLKGAGKAVTDSVKVEVQKLQGEEVPEWERQDYLADVAAVNSLGMGSVHAGAYDSGNAGAGGGNGGGGFFAGVFNALASTGGITGTEFTAAGGMFHRRGSTGGGAAGAGGGGAGGAAGGDDDFTPGAAGLDAVTYFESMRARSKGSGTGGGGSGSGISNLMGGKTASWQARLFEVDALGQFGEEEEEGEGTAAAASAPAAAGHARGRAAAGPAAGGFDAAVEAAPAAGEAGAGQGSGGGGVKSNPFDSW